jgi:hypothetical protein
MKPAILEGNSRVFADKVIGAHTHLQIELENPAHNFANDLIIYFWQQSCPFPSFWPFFAFQSGITNQKTSQTRSKFCKLGHLSYTVALRRISICPTVFGAEAAAIELFPS